MEPQTCGEQNLKNYLEDGTIPELGIRERVWGLHLLLASCVPWSVHLTFLRASSTTRNMAMHDQMVIKVPFKTERFWSKVHFHCLSHTSSHPRLVLPPWGAGKPQSTPLTSRAPSRLGPSPPSSSKDFRGHDGTARSSPHGSVHLLLDVSWKREMTDPSHVC